MDNLTSILRIPALNLDVKNKILRFIQNWATAFEGKPMLSYVGQVYKNLKSDGMYLYRLFNVFASPACIALLYRIQLPATGPRGRKLSDGRHADRTGVDRLRRLSALSHPVLVYESQTPLP